MTFPGRGDGCTRHLRRSTVICGTTCDPPDASSIYPVIAVIQPRNASFRAVGKASAHAAAGHRKTKPVRPESGTRGPSGRWRGGSVPNTVRRSPRRTLAPRRTAGRTPRNSGHPRSPRTVADSRGAIRRTWPPAGRSLAIRWAFVGTADRAEPLSADPARCRDIPEGCPRFPLGWVPGGVLVWRAWRGGGMLRESRIPGGKGLRGQLTRAFSPASDREAPACGGDRGGLPRPGSRS